MIDYHDLDLSSLEQVRAKIEKDKDFSIIIPYANALSEQYLSAVLGIFLLMMNKTNLLTFLEYCLKELVMNGSKANSKRIYFREKRLRIADPGDYQKGIQNFKSDVFGNFAAFEAKHKELGALAKIQFKLTENTFFIQVINNSVLCKEEKERIEERLKIADKFNTMAEVLTYGFDESEGAGFGLIIAVLMLRKMNLDEKAYSIKATDKYTLSTLSIPLNLISAEQGAILAKEITDEMDSMPQFPEGILRLQKALADTNCDFESLARIISQDSALTTEIIRIANSPLYRLQHKVEDVVSAVRMIGLNGVRNLVLSFGVNKIFEQKYKKDKIDAVMQHSYQVALYCSQITRIKHMGKLRDDIYVAALLHDLGKIVVNSLQPLLSAKLEKICEVRRIPVSALESLTDGYNHSLIGGLLAEKWNFPPKFVQAIQYHHIPLEAAEEHRTIVAVIYLANECYYFLKGVRRFEELNYRILKFFTIEAQDKFIEFVKHMEAGLKASQ